MKFELLPVINKMLELYKKPANFDRFREYLALIEGETKGDLSLPIGNFNPMAKEHVTEKLNELKNLHAEELIHETLQKINAQFSAEKKENFKVVLNLADDLKGGWTNRYTTDYDSKFRIQALVGRKFCTPVFWTSEKYSAEIIAGRTQEYCFRTAYWLSHPKPKTLEQHIAQEKYVHEKMKPPRKNSACDFAALNKFYAAHKQTEDYPVIFNFLYGDNAAVALGYAPMGIKEDMAGFEFANYSALNKK